MREGCDSRALREPRAYLDDAPPVDTPAIPSTPDNLPIAIFSPGLRSLQNANVVRLALEEEAQRRQAPSARLADVQH